MAFALLTSREQPLGVRGRKRRRPTNRKALILKFKKIKY